MVDPHNIMPTKFHHATQGIANDGGSQMTYMHFLDNEMVVVDEGVRRRWRGRGGR